MLHSDEPVLDDELNHAAHVETVGHIVQTCGTPFAIGIHGDWGTGKTSFLRKLHLYLAGKESGFDDADEIGKRLWPNTYHGNGRGVETVWFEAWRYQHEQTPIIALLQEIRAHFAWRTSLADKAGKMTYAALMSLESITDKIGIQASKIVEGGEKWERDRLQQPLPSQLCRDLLEQAIKTVLDNRSTKRHPKTKLVIFVDDLDRCQGHVAFRLLEAMKIYLSIPSCVFVLGLDWQNVKRAVAAEMIKSGMVAADRPEEAMIQAGDYLHKLCQMVEPLPLMSQPRRYVSSLMTDDVFTMPNTSQLDERWLDLIKTHELLPRNPRKIKAFVNGLALYLKQLQPVLDAKNQDLNAHLALIVAYLKLNEDRVYRVLETDVGFWDEMVKFCRIGGKSRPDLHLVFGSRSLRDSPVFTDSGSLDVEDIPSGYLPAFPDPADEGVFRAASLIRSWRNGNPPTDDEFKWYVQLRTE